jgi:hypothetical protein
MAMRAVYQVFYRKPFYRKPLSMKTPAIFVADPDGWPESSGVLFRDDSTVVDDPTQMEHSLCLTGRAPMES